MSQSYDDRVHFERGDFKGTVIGKIEYGKQAPAPTALDSLPAKAAGFTGRDEELGQLLDALDGASEMVLVAAVSGLGGIGKTALAVAAAHEARGRGWFPGGVLFVDLHGYDDALVTADQALRSLLRALGVEPEHIPAAADERAALYRSMLARRGGERGAVLILADNASSPDQVRPLLPGDACHRVLVTSRDRLTQLPARLVSLDQLTAEGAYELLDRALRISDPADGRITTAPGAVAELAALCGHLPLALQIAAALLAQEPDKPVSELVGELAASRDLLADLDDGERSVRAAFDLSYRRLPAEQGRLLRLLALAPGPEVSDDVAAALVGAETVPLRDLRALARAHLVEQTSRRGWWRLHDLVRVFGVGVAAGEAGSREEGVAARERVLEFYHRRAGAADDRLQRLLGPVRITDRVQALAWLDGERAGLVAAAQWTREERFADTALRLAERLQTYLQWRRYLDDSIMVNRAAQEAAHRIGDRHREANAWNNLGHAFREVGRVEEAIEAHTRARDLCQEVGDRRLVAIVLMSLAMALWVADRMEEAFDALTRAHEPFRTTGNHSSDGLAWTGMGLAVTLGEMGRVEEAIEAHIEAHDRFQTAGDRPGEAIAWLGLGLTLRKAGRTEKAVAALTRARDHFQAAGDRYSEAGAWNNLGLALRELGREEEAIEAYGKAVEIWVEFEDWYRAGRDINKLAAAHLSVHRPAEARAHLLRAAEAFTRANDPTSAAKARAVAAELATPARIPPDYRPLSTPLTHRYTSSGLPTCP